MQVPCHGRQLDPQAVQFLRHRHLAAKSTCLRQSECKIQHIVLVVLGLGHLIIELLVCHNDVTCTTGAGSSTCSFHLQVVRLCNIEQVVALAYSDLVFAVFLIDKRDVESAEGICQSRVLKGIRGLRLLFARFRWCNMPMQPPW